MTLPDGKRDGMGSDGRWMSSMPAKEQTALLLDIGFEVVQTGKVRMYNGSDWLVTLSRKNN